MEHSLPPDLRISTITATSKIDSRIDIQKVYNTLIINEIFNYIEYGDKDYKGVSQKKISPKKKQNKKVFFNQITVEINMNGIINNLKLFNNGSISMTGVKNIESGKNAIQILFNYLKDNDITIFGKSNPVIEFFKIVLINSDFKLNFEIKRSELHQILVNNYKIYSSYEPCIYPGVNSKYFWNKKYNNKIITSKEFQFINGKFIIIFDIKSDELSSRIKEEINSDLMKSKYKFDIEQLFNKKILVSDIDNITFVDSNEHLVLEIDLNKQIDFKQIITNQIKETSFKLKIIYNYKGSCYCDGFCEGKGSGFGEKQCKKVTISAFQSGSIIITGANTTEQILDSYNFINKIINNHSNKIKKERSDLKKEDEFIYIKKTNIVRT